MNNPKGVLNEWSQSRRSGLPTYETGGSADLGFTCTVYIGEELAGTGIGRNKKTAEQNAAADALSQLDPSPSSTIGGHVRRRPKIALHSEDEETDERDRDNLTQLAAGLKALEERMNKLEMAVGSMQGRMNAPSPKIPTTPTSERDLHGGTLSQSSKTGQRSGVELVRALEPKQRGSRACIVGDSGWKMFNKG
jgi:hypothetical protein